MDIEYPLRSNALSAKSILGGRVALTLGSDIEYPLRSNALSAKSVLGGRVALTIPALATLP